MIKKTYLMILSVATISALIGSLSYSNITLAQQGKKPTPVEVTNWTVEQELFPENLILRGTSNGRLIDETTLPDMQWPYHHVSEIIDTDYTEIYSRTFVYQKIPTRAYQILGIPMFSLTVNMSSSTSNYVSQWISVDLYKKSMSGEMTRLSAIGPDPGMGFGVKGPFNNDQFTFPVTVHSTIPINVTIEPYERLAINIKVSAKTQTEATKLAWTLWFEKYEDTILLDIPIVKNP